MKSFLKLTVASALALAALASPANAAFGLSDIELSFTPAPGTPPMQAGSHPEGVTTFFALNYVGAPGEEQVEGAIRDLRVELPPGFAGSPTATPRCSTLEFLAVGEGGSKPACANSTAIGRAAPAIFPDQLDPERSSTAEPGTATAVYNLEPPPGVAAKLGFWVLDQVPVTIEVGVNPEPPHNVVAVLRNTVQTLEVFGGGVTLWGNPADPSHDGVRGRCSEVGGTCKAGIPVEPFITMPRSCTGPLQTAFAATPWWTGDPLAPTPGGAPFSARVATPPGATGCGTLGLTPRISVQPSTDAAESPSGIEVNLQIDDEGLTAPDGTAGSDIKTAEVTLPRGVTANPSLAEGLATCSPADLERETLASEPGEGCPQASKIGSVEVESPLLEGELLRGSLHIASQNENPFDSLLALYMVVKHPKQGILIKLAGKITPDPETGQLVTIFGDPTARDPRFRTLPQLPFSDFRLRFREGGRSPLITPPSCGTYSTLAELTPWANPDQPISISAEFEITGGVGGAPCPSGPQPFEPGFEAGSLNNAAGAYSPFHMRLTRRDGDQDLARFDATLPKGMIAKLAGVSQCGEAQIAAARARISGRAELASPSCPDSSRLGTVYGGAGVGSQLTYVPGSIYLAGPTRGAPLSVVAIVPAVAGPFDVGNVVVRQALKVDPVTADVKVDSAASDALPTMLAGIPLKVRDVRVEVDRPNFTLNPTSCDPSTMSAGLWAIGAGAPVIRDQRFQAADCAALGFKPKLALNLKGGTKRGQFPALTTTYTPRPGDANLKGLSLRLPRSAFLEQGHFRTICTRVQFAADACPAGAVYGQVKAFTPLLDQPLAGPIYLRSSSHDLPDIVFDLKGLVDVEASARVDSVNGGIRVRIDNVPDAPISKVVVTMQGGQKGLIVNSRDLCAKPSRASGEASAQNGKRATLKPLVKVKGCKGQKRAVKQKSRGGRARR